MALKTLDGASNLSASKYILQNYSIFIILFVYKSVHPVVDEEIYQTERSVKYYFVSKIKCTVELQFNDIKRNEHR